MQQLNLPHLDLDSSDTSSHMQTLPPNKSGYTCKINKYICLGSGSFGSVFPGYFKSISGHKVHIAVKILNIKQLERENEEYLKMLQNQKRIFKQVFNSKHIVRLYSCIRDRESIYFVMEKCDEDLAGFMRGKEVNQKEIRFYFRQILMGYNELYKRKIEHNDIKPQNILVKDRSVLKLADFGLAYNSMDTNSSFARINRSWNTTAPQVRFKDLGKITSKSDMWSLGVVLYWMIYKKYPYHENTTVDSYRVKLEFPIISSQLKNVLSGLIEFDLEKRWDFQKLFADNLFNKEHFIEQQMNNYEYLFEQPIFIEISQLSSCLDKKTSIQFYLQDDEFQQDEIQTSLKKKIQIQSSKIKLKMSYLRLLIKKIQSYSIYNISPSKSTLRRQILFLKKLTIEGIKHYIHSFYQELSDDGNFLSCQVLIKARQNQEATSYLNYLAAVCKVEIGKWREMMVEENALVKMYGEEIEEYQWVLKKNWKHTKKDIMGHLLALTRDFILEMKKVKLQKQEYLLIHYLLLLYFHQDIFQSLQNQHNSQQLHKFISYLSQSDPTINQQQLQSTLKSLL